MTRESCLLSAANTDAVKAENVRLFRKDAVIFVLCYHAVYIRYQFQCSEEGCCNLFTLPLLVRLLSV